MLKNINELEMYNGYLLANIFLKDVIIKIDLEKGVLVDVFDMSGLK